MHSILYTFKQNNKRKVLQVSVIVISFILLPIYAMIMGYLNGVELGIVSIIGIFVIIGIFLCTMIMKTRIEMFSDEMIIYGFKKRTIKYKNIKNISFQKNYASDSDGEHSKSYYFILEFDNKLSNDISPVALDSKVGGIEITYGVDLDFLASLHDKQCFLNTILKYNPRIQLDEVTLAYKEGKI